MTNKTYGPDKLTIDQMHSNRQNADKAGHSYFFTGKPCRHGHIAPRTVSGAVCVDCRSIHYEKLKRLRRELGKPKREAKERIRKLREQEKAIKRYGPDKLVLEDMKPNKREAIEIGHSHYFTGKPCRYGHLAPRQTINATCVHCARDHSNKYQKKEP